MTDQTVNIPLLRKAVEWAEAEAAKPAAEQQEWDQSYWRVRPRERAADLDVEVAKCGASYCIAGWVCVMSGEEFHPTADNLLKGNAHPADKAAELLGIRSGSAAALFNGGNTIEDVRRIAEDIAGERL